jgi:hypothetical protein
MRDLAAASGVAAGRYSIFHAGRECGEERWRIEVGPEGLIATGEQVLGPPHPFPSLSEYRVTLTDAMRVTGLEILWTVGAHRLRATHAASGRTWRAQIETQGRVREQQGDFPDGCEVEFGTHLFNSFILARRDFQVDGEHEFPVLRIGPPWMAVTPERMLYRCVERGTFAAPWGGVPAKRYVLSLPPRPEQEGYTFWADERDVVLESYEGLDTSRPWMRLTELTRGT